MQKLTMVKILFVGLCDLQTLFGIYEQFMNVLWKKHVIDNVHKSLWNSAQVSHDLSTG